MCSQWQLHNCLFSATHTFNFQWFRIISWKMFIHPLSNPLVSCFDSCTQTRAEQNKAENKNELVGVKIANIFHWFNSISHLRPCHVTTFVERIFQTSKWASVAPNCRIFLPAYSFDKISVFEITNRFVSTSFVCVFFVSKLFSFLVQFKIQIEEQNCQHDKIPSIINVM